MAFSITSSRATLSVMLEAAESELRISRTVASFALPLGASIGRSGSALFQAVAVLFVARLYGIPLGVGGTFQAGAALFPPSLTLAGGSPAGRLRPLAAVPPPGPPPPGPPPLVRA